MAYRGEMKNTHTVSGDGLILYGHIYTAASRLNDVSGGGHGVWISGL